MVRERTASKNTGMADSGANQTLDFEQVVVKSIEPEAGPSLIPQTSVQAEDEDERILIEKNKYKYPNVSIDQALLEGLTSDQIVEALWAYNVVVLKRKPNHAGPSQLSGESEHSHCSRRSAFDRIDNE